jgi:hypothetical protein
MALAADQVVVAAFQWVPTIVVALELLDKEILGLLVALVII